MGRWVDTLIVSMFVNGLKNIYWATFALYRKIFPPYFIFVFSISEMAA